MAFGKLRFRLLLGALACFALLFNVAMAAHRIGVGKGDITGPAAEVVMMGFADSNEKSAGILNRLYARAFIIEDTTTSQRVVFVNCDLQAVFQLVHQEVIKQLKTKYNGVYTEQNVVLHATHTHAGPGGTAGYFLYDVSIFGYINENFEMIVSGILKAIDAAHNSVAPGTIRFNKGKIPNGGKNRSPEAYAANPEAEKALYEGNRDTDMRALHSKLRGVLAFYPVHPTSLTQYNLLVSGDNKGYAEFLVEDKFPGVIVGIGISNAADVSPNLVDNGNGTWTGEGKNPIENAEIIGARQASKLCELLTLSSELLEGSVLGKLSYVDYSNVTLKDRSPTAADPYNARTCPAVVGQNFAAGTEDGRAIQGFTEGDLNTNPLFAFAGSVVKDTPQWVRDCQNKIKSPLLATGLITPVPWTPEVLPVQVLKIGQFGIAVTNFEVSTMSGRRIRNTVKGVLASVGVTEVEVASISNAYAQYLTTREEYFIQAYEGASTLFGPNQLAAVQQELARVAASIANPALPLDVGPTPRQFDRSKLVNFQTGVVFDTVPIGKSFGSIRTNPAASYTIGSTASALFYGAHPKNNLNLVTSFCDVERQVSAGVFETVMTDAHWDVRFRWARDSIADSKSTCEWFIRAGSRTSVAGTYRFRQRGYSKPLIGSIKAYEGVSATFIVA
uniref:Neutral ceramidase n=1 Tax=Globisporangium ultimum (strain ATCC 200006 / CBS 805.95 / DAOM BR144) TaxID=431595 RepID=K3WIZ4_GLOUD